MNMKLALLTLLLAGCSDAVATSSVPFVPSTEFVKGLDDWKIGAPAIATPAPPVPTAPVQGTWIDGWVDSFFKTHELHVSVNPKSYGEPQRITSGLTAESSPSASCVVHKPDTAAAGRPAVLPVRGPDGTRGPIAGRGPDSGSAPPVEDAFPDSQATFVFQYRSAKALGGNTFVRFCNENHGRSVTGWKFIFQAIVPTGHGTSKTMLNGTVGGIDSSCFCNCGPDGFYSLKNGQVLNVASAKLLPGDGGLTLVECQLSGPNGDIGESRAPMASNAVAYAEPNTADVSPNFTGAGVYHAAWCKFCPALVDGLRKRASDTWTDPKSKREYLKVDGCWFALIDYDERPVNEPMVSELPTVIYFVNGKERASTKDMPGRTVGFDGTDAALNRVIARHPKCSLTSSVKAAVLATPRPLSVDCSQPVVPWATGPQDLWPWRYTTAGAFPMQSPCYGGTCSVNGGAPVLQQGPMAGAPLYQETWGAVPAQSGASVSILGVPLISGSVGSW